MNHFSKIVDSINTLLYKHNCVIVPGFGGFLSHEKPAEFILNTQVLSPPIKNVGFNINLKTDDGLLCTTIAEQFNEDYLQAKIRLSEFCNYCNGLLKLKQQLSFGTIGNFYIDFEGNLNFEPSSQNNYLKSSFGLKPLFLKEITPLKKEPSENNNSINPNAHFKDRNPVETVEHNLLKQNTKRTKIGISLILFLFIMAAIVGLYFKPNADLTNLFTANVLSNNALSNFQQLNYSNLELKEILDLKSENYVADANNIAFYEISKTKKVAVRLSTLVSNAPKISTIKNINEKEFQIVVGCFGIAQNAERLISKLKTNGFNAFENGRTPKNLIIVSAGAFNSKEEAMLTLNQVKTICPNAWIKNK
ncbi:MAG: SPOR domain-containing protein [Bacteroidetes bacterium]|nr:SPOR domain-containing protein [Bacteroidota bacterium]